ncbi:hypothetical protein BDW22DRAFT_370529 [Trametopsis cervina]|nr:hypothetical protein BDW22DRAFT_370529 [Trametopsis cervina]
MIANHASSTSCVSECRCGADLTNEVHYARLEVAECDKALIELRNSAVPEEDIQAAQTARHVAQERLDRAFEAFMEFHNASPMRNTAVDDEEAMSSDDEDGGPDTDDGDESDRPIGNIDTFADVDDDEEEDESYIPDK